MENEISIEYFKNKKVLVLGLSVTGVAAAKFFARIGADCFLSEFSKEKDTDFEKIAELKALGVKVEMGGHSDEFINGACIAVVSPSIPFKSPIIARLEQSKILYCSDLQLAKKVLKDDVKMVVITGTNGKTTTTMLMSHILSQKFNAPFVGNVGVSPLDYIENGAKPDVLVCEASSYQLHYSKEFVPEYAIFCNITPDHLDWHGSYENYFNDKADFFRNLKPACHAVFNHDDKKVLGLKDETDAKVHLFALEEVEHNENAYIKDNSVFYGDEFIIKTQDVPIVGPHNLQNVMCAVIVAKNLGLDNETIKNAIMSFKAPLHRCEFIENIDSVRFYNDSKATNPEASIVAINSFVNENVVLIAGGRDKNTSLDDFCSAVIDRVKTVVLIGEATKRFKQALLNSGFSNIHCAATLEDAIDLSISLKPDIVLFSPACASFDMFKNYEMRGDTFREYVLSKRQ